MGHGGLPMQIKFDHYLNVDLLPLDHLVGGWVDAGSEQEVGGADASIGRTLQVCFLSLECHCMDRNSGGG